MSTSPTNGRPAAPPERGGSPLADLVSAEARALRARGDDLARFAADELDRLAQLVAFTGATTPREYRDRLETIDRDRDDAQEQAAWDAGFRAGRAAGIDQGLREAILVIKRSSHIQ